MSLVFSDICILMRCMFIVMSGVYLSTLEPWIYEAGPMHPEVYDVMPGASFAMGMMWKFNRVALK